MLDKLPSPGVLVVLVGALAALLGLVAALLRLLPALVAFGLVTGGCALGGLAALVLVWTQRSPLAALIAVLLLAYPVVLAVQASRAARMHDVTTDLDDPPVFVLAAREVANQGRDLSYPEGPSDTSQQQRRFYPDLRPLRLEVPAARALELARRAARAQGWTLLGDEGTGSASFEAVDRTRIFGFADDVVVRVRPQGDGESVIDVRSTSRDGTGDLGANAARIRAFLAALSALAEASGNSAPGV